MVLIQKDYTLSVFYLDSKTPVILYPEDASSLKNLENIRVIYYKGNCIYEKKEGFKLVEITFSKDNSPRSKYYNIEFIVEEENGKRSEQIYEEVKPEVKLTNTIIVEIKFKLLPLHRFNCAPKDAKSIRESYKDNPMVESIKFIIPSV